MSSVSSDEDSRFEAIDSEFETHLDKIEDFTKRKTTHTANQVLLKKNDTLFYKGKKVKLPKTIDQISSKNLEESLEKAWNELFNKE